MRLSILTSVARPSQMDLAHEGNKKITDCLSLSIKNICNSSMEIDNKPRVLNHNGISISQTGFAKQLVIMTHGGWKEIERNATVFRRQAGDGWTSVPHGTRIDFYTEDNNFTKGPTVLAEVNKRPHDALNGLELSIDLSDSDIELLARSRNMSASDIKDEMMKLATYRKECVNNGDVVKNYALYHHEQTDTLMEKHQNESGNKEVDIAFVTDKKHKKHLSDVFEAIKKAGVEYEVIHFGACRVSRDGHAIPNLDNHNAKK
ncbi:adhesin [Salmonella enterica]|nr:adhesin [Salmonella enterica]